MNNLRAVIGLAVFFLLTLVAGCQAWDYDAIPDIKDNDKMIAYCSKQLSLHPDDPRYFYYRGAACFSNDQPELALPDLSRAIELDDGYVYSYYYRAASYYKLGQYQTARQDLQTVLDLLAKSKDKYKKIEINTYDMLFGINIKEEKDEQALAIANQGLARYPDNRKLREDQAIAYYYLKDDQKSLSIMRGLAAEYPEDMKIVFNYAVAMALCEDPKLVDMDEFKKYAFLLFDHFPRDYRAYFIMAKYDQVSGNFAGAKQCLAESYQQYDAKTRPNVYKSMEELKKALNMEESAPAVSTPAAGQK